MAAAERSTRSRARVGCAEPMARGVFSAAGALGLALAACGGAEEPTAKSTTPAEAADLMDEAAERGLDYVNRSGEPAKTTIL